MFKCKNLKAYWVALFLIATGNLATNAYGATLYQQPYDPTVYGPLADAASPLTYDNFEVQAMTLTDIVWWGIPGIQDDNFFSLKIYAFDNSFPGAELFSVNDVLITPVPDQNGGFSQYRHTLSNLIDLNGKYFLSIQNTGFGGWAWLYGTGGDGSSLYQNGPDFFVDTQDLAFALEGNRIQTVPEPNTIPLLLIGFGIIILLQQSFKRNFLA